MFLEDPNLGLFQSPSLCGMATDSSCNTFLGIWTVGILGSCYPSDQGIKFGLTKFRKVLIEVRTKNRSAADTLTHTLDW